MTVSVGISEPVFWKEDRMEGDLFFTTDHLMFLCKKPIIIDRSNTSKAAHLGLNIITLGHSGEFDDYK